MSRSARVTAQAKVNLLLRVLARESSGYHGIETIFLRLDLGDDVCVRLASGRSLDCSGPAMPAGGLGPVEKNLAFRAAAQYAEATGWPSGFAIEVVKRIPVGGGLGGGSADAGGVLRALDALSPNPLGDRLAEIAATLGADVPFMTIESPMALGWGRGDRLLPLPPPAPRAVALAVPDFSISTADAYGWLASDRSGNEPAGRVESRYSLTTGWSFSSTGTAWDAIAAVAENDFQPIVARRHPQITQLVDGLASAGAIISMLSGSGSAVFGVFAQPPDAGEIARRLGCETLVTQTSERVVRVELNG